MKNRVRTPGQQPYAKTQKGKCARASYCNQKWERTEGRFQQSIYRELCQISITIEGGGFWNSSLNQRTKYWSYASYFIAALKLALPLHRIQSASFDRKWAQHLRIELFDSSISYKVPYRTLTPKPAPYKITDVKRQRLWTIWIGKNGSFISPRTRVHCPVRGRNFSRHTIVGPRRWTGRKGSLWLSSVRVTRSALVGVLASTPQT